MGTRVKAVVILVLGLGLVGASRAAAQTVLESAGLRLEIDGRGAIARLADPRTGREYLPEGVPGYLVRVREAGGAELAPVSLKPAKDLWTFTFDGGIALTVRASRKSGYLRFELVRAVRPERIDAVLWGPIPTTIGDTVGEVVGVVRDADHAVGIQTLNTKTCGGKLVNAEGTTGGRTTATKEAYGSSLQAFTVNQARDRVIPVWGQFADVPVRALPGFKLEGSALALFGATPDRALPLIGEIERAEGLPHPTIDGEWVKTSKAPGRPYLIAEFGEDGFDALLEYALRLGFPAVYHSGPFETWGHFDLRKDLFPNGRAGFKACVDKARARGLRVGAHTLTNFITTNDPFVTTGANRGLMGAGAATLGRAIDAAATEIVVDREDLFRQASTLQSALIGTEIVRYREVTGTGPYTLTDCVRGAFGTPAAAHAAGVEVRKLMDHPYKTFFPDWPMQEELIANLAGFFAETGASQMDFDGHEGTCYLGRGDFGHVHFVEAFLGRVGHPVVNGSSNIGHYYWHFNSYINWGEPWYASFRESQSGYRIDNQALYERNYMPHMLGWFLMTPDTRLEDIEWMLARAAGFDAGYAFVAELASLRQNPATDAIVEAVRTWEEAKASGAFSDEQRSRLKDPERDFRLEKAGQGRWVLRSVDKFRFEHRRKVLQPGEPAGSEWRFATGSEARPLHLQLLVAGEGAEARDITLEVDRFFRVAVPNVLSAGASLVWDGSDRILLYDDKGRKTGAVDVGKGLPLLREGTHTVAVDAKLEGDGAVIKGIVRVAGRVEPVGR
ncbi:MAG: hypothetical protein KA243_09950 [Candidatus Aminicenantes bacterium]|nr:hypothetical protein [Candidatus Aminicenantes bacterium]NLH76451.1 hypothetical protein [Acidobacteriota bacterium]